LHSGCELEDSALFHPLSQGKLVMIYLATQSFDNAGFRSMLEYYSQWGINVGLGMLSAIFFASLLGFIVRSM
jgi:hypothetical protein